METVFLVPDRTVIVTPVRVYLVGPISGLSYQQAIDWRSRANQALAEHGIETICPLRNTEILEGEEALEQEYSAWLWTQARAIVHRSLYDVRRSDAILANFLGAQQRSMGSIVELAVAYERHIPIVVVMEQGNPHDHIFIREMATVVVDDLDSGIEATWRLFA